MRSFRTGLITDLFARLRAGMGLRERAVAVLLILAITVAATGRGVERVGDNLQIALPLIAWGCTALNGNAREFAGRFLVTMAAVHAIKHGSGDAELALRPSGGELGMPSGHTAAAAFGASSIVNDCLKGNVIVAGITVLAAGFVGVSRVEAEKHDAWQVFWGGLMGWAGDRALRRRSPARAYAGRKLSRAAAGLGRVLRPLREMALRAWRALTLLPG